MLFHRFQPPTITAEGLDLGRCVIRGKGWVAILSMVLLEPPAPADLVLVGRALAIFSFWSAAARRRMAVRGPPGGVGDEGRPMLAPLAAAGELAGEEARGEDYSIRLMSVN